MMRSAAWSKGWSVARAAMAIVTITAIVAQLSKSVGTAAGLGRDVTTTIVNFFSFFTILANASSAVVLLWAVIWFWTRGRQALSAAPPAAAPSAVSGRTGPAEPLGLAVALASVSTYMIITGIVYNSLLRNIELPQGSEPIWWSNEVLHLIGPLFLLADVFFGPLRRALPWRSLWAIVAFPILWVAYTMLRGPLVTNPVNGEPFWYPYPFLNPNSAGGWPSVLLYVIGIAVAIVAVGSLVVWWGRRIGTSGSLVAGTSATVLSEA
ncbi:Pr6Pr family membrane protein [Microbacterium allomyrinae]|jgi:hypothetical protein|nr:Pr6Pr family membrane protein [Microbacterium allomyrinae]